MSPADERPDERAEPRLVLEVVGSSQAAVELPRAGVLTLGNRSGKADLALDGQGISDVHCAIGRIKGGEGWALKDLGSQYGTLVNGERVATRKLEAGDQVVLGACLLRVVDPQRPVEASRPEPAAEADAEGTPLTRTALAGARIVQGYRIEKPLGRGGMGQVFLAVQESLQRKVALKVLAERLSADADFVRRFQAEARAAAALNHPNIVTVHDVWEEGGRHFLSMEYMDHGTLESRLGAAGRLPAREVLEVLSDAAKGLVYAELRGIVHRDIKPANLMQNEVGTTKIADLGLATHLEAEATDEGDGKIFGTPHFISPEQARGERVDGRSDLYSLGATAYRLLSGHTPFEGATTREILRGHFFERPRPLSQHVPDVPPELERLVARLLEKKPEDRYPSAGALLQDIERLKSQLVHGLGAPPPPSRRWAAPLVALALVAAAAGLWLAFGGRGEQPPSHVEASAGHGSSGDGAPPDPTRAPVSEPADPAAPEDVAPAEPPPAPFDDDSTLVRLEREAAEAYAALPQSYEGEGRREALLELARRFPGTTWVARFESEADQIARELAAGDAARAARSQALSQLVAELEATARADEARPLAATLQAMAAVELPPHLAEDPQVRARWTEAWEQTLAGAAQRGDQALDEAGRLARDGDFLGVRRTLDAARAALAPEGWPALPDGLSAAEGGALARVSAVRQELDDRLAGLAREEALHARDQARDDRAALSAALAGPGGLERELRALDFEAADRRLAALLEGLRTPARRDAVRGLRGDLAAARDALAMLAREWDREGWKRKTVFDPRAGGRSTGEAVGVEARGLLLKRGGEAELVPWSAFANRPDELHQLFYERLSRAYGEDEVAGIEALLRVAAVLNAIDEGSEILIEGGGHVLTEEEAGLLLAGFELAAPWARQGRRERAFEHEREAARLLAGALRQASEDRWTLAQVSLERLLVEQGDSLLVWLLSDGRPLPQFEAPLPEVPAATAAQAPHDAGGDDDPRER